MPTEKSPAPAGGGWRMLRLALLCARRGSKRIVADIRRGLSHLKSLRAERSCHSYRLHYYAEHELSFDDTSPFRFKKHRHRLFPCIDPPLVGFDDDDQDDDNSTTTAGCSGHVLEGEEYATNGDGDGGKNNHGEESCIDSKAEEFISRFYEDMKLQRQVSFLRYKEMFCS